jgi:hypothetical protein
MASDREVAGWSRFSRLERDPSDSNARTLQTVYAFIAVRGNSWGGDYRVSGVDFCVLSILLRAYFRRSGSRRAFNFAMRAGSSPSSVA